MKTFVEILKSYSAVALAFITSFVYTCTYQYERQFLDAFGISSDYISIDINLVLKNSLYVAGPIAFVLFIVTYYNIFVHLIPSTFSGIKKFLRIQSALFFIILIISVAIPVPLFIVDNLYWIAGIWLSISIGMFWWNTRKKTNHNEEENINTEENDDRVSDPEDVKKLQRFLVGLVAFLLGFVLWSIQFMFQQVGRGDALDKRVFEMVDDSTRYIVIRKYGEELLCVDYDFKKRKKGNRIILIKESPGRPLILLKQDLGYVADTLNIYHAPLPSEARKKNLLPTKKQKR